MIDMLKKTLLAGMGATVVTAERVEATLEELVKRGKLTADEARELASKLADDSKREFEDVRGAMGQLADEMMTKANMATKRDVARLEAKIDALQAQIDSLAISQTPTPPQE